MFIITLKTGGVNTVIHESGSSKTKVDGAKISREVNKFDSLSFDIYPDNPGYNSITPFATTVEVMNLKTGATAFEGRVIQLVPSMDSDGSIMKSVTCESLMAYLCDSLQEWEDTAHYDASGSKSGLQVYIEKLLAVHNAKVEERKRIYAGNITLQTFETSDGVTKGVSRASTWDNINDKLIGSFGGEMRVRRGSDGLLYLDYAEHLGTTRATRIQVAWNMQDAEREVDPNGIITRLYPYGAKLTETVTDPDTGEDEEVETEERLTIESVNNGLKYIDDAVAIEQYGIIEGSNEWDDVTVASNLLTKARAWLGANNALPATHTFSALDLSLIGLDYDGFEIFDSYPCYNPMLGIDETLEIVKQSIDINEPENSSFDMGETSFRLSNDIGKNDGLSQDFEEFKGQTETGIKNVNNSIKSTKAAIKVFDDRIESTVEEKVEQTVTQEIGTVTVSVTTEYYVSSSPSALTGGSWSEQSPTWQAGTYIWTRTKTTSKNGTVTYSNAACVTGAQGAQGDAGDDGKGVTVSSVQVVYQSGTSGTTAPTGQWSQSVPSVPEGQYLWTRTTVSYSDGTDAVSYSVARMGADGADGNDGTDGVGISSTAVTYQASASGTTVPSGAWSSSIPTVSAGQYLWTRTVTSYTNGESTTAYSVGKMGENGTDGTDGKGISSTAVTYQAGASQTTAPTGTWQSAVPKLSTALPYLWTRTITTYTDSSSTTAYSVGSTLESFEVGGRNLLLASDNDYSNDDYPTHIYTMSGKMTAGETYTLRVWGELGDGKTGFSAYLDGGSISLGGLTDNGDGTYSMTFAGKSGTKEPSEISIYPMPSIVTATSTIDRIKLELGNKSTDWTPAPEDVDQSIGNVQENIENVNQDLSDSLGSISDELGNVQGDLSNALETINSTVTRLTELEQTASGWSFNFTEIREELTQIGDQISTSSSEQLKYIKFIDGEIWLGRDPDPGEDDFKVVISNQRIRFLQNNIEVAYISNQQLYITNAQVMNRLDIGNFAFFPRQNGNLTLRYTG